MKEQREKEMLEYAQNANETRSIIGFPEDGESSRSAMKVGRLIVKPTVLGYGSCGTVVFDGELDGRSVAVKRLLAQFHELARKELAALIASDEHPNILRCFAMEEDKDFVYVALELCETTLQARATETTKTSDSAPLLDTSGFPTSDGVRILRDVAAGLKQLHSQGIVHRDLKPSNILITEKGRGKLADMGVAKKVNLIDGTSFETRAILNNNNGGSAGGGGGDGTAGWQAPERLTNGRQSRAVDIFALGCVVHFVLTKGKHPFGEKFERDSRVLRGDYNVSALNHLPEAKDLVRKCLEANPKTGHPRERFSDTPRGGREKSARSSYATLATAWNSKTANQESASFSKLWRELLNSPSPTPIGARKSIRLCSKISKSTANTTVVPCATYFESSATNPHTSANCLRASSASSANPQTRSTPTSHLDFPTSS